MRKVVAVIAIQDAHLLLVKKKETWILPGGKPDVGETDKACLLRELREELPGCTVTVHSMLGSWAGRAPHTGDTIECWAYFGKVEGDIHPSAEISDARWVPADELEQYLLSDVTGKIADFLKSASRL